VKKFVALTALALLAAAGSANAQGFRLDLSLTARLQTPGLADDGTTPINDVLTDVPASTNGTVAAVPGQTYVIELRYRIADLVADTAGSLGLSAASIHLSGANNNGSVSRFTLTNFLESGNDSTGTPKNVAVYNPDQSGPGSGSTGLVNLFRGGLTSDTDAANGNVTATNTPGLAIAGWDIVPLALAQPAQKSFTGTNPTASNTNNNASVWAIYDFLYTVGAGTNTLTASAVADAQTGNRFGFFERSGTANNPVPVTSTLATDGTITFLVVPAPASAALMGIGGLVAIRRRRA